MKKYFLILLSAVLLLATPAFAINPSYKTWDGNECLVIATNDLVPCTKWMLADIDRRTCYDPHAITDCRAHWSGSRGGGQGIAENCHKLPLCPSLPGPLP